MLFTTACSKENLMHEGEGAITFALGATRANSDLLDGVKDKLTFRIYSVANLGAVDEAETLVRLYTYDEIIGDASSPMKIWLVAGDYRVKVEGGEKSEASFQDIYYVGSQNFTVTEGTNSEVEVTCRPSNSMIKVIFDESVPQNMGVTASTIVAIDDEYDAVAISQNMVPNLTYTSTSVGYFMPTEDDTKFVWKFTGVVAAKNNAQVEKMGTYTPEGGFKPGYMYTLTFKYSPDLGGYVTLDVKVDKEPTEYNNSAIFVPEPQLSDVPNYPSVVNKTAQIYNGMTVAYGLKAINDITEMSVNVDGQTMTYTAAQMTQDVTRATYKGFVDEANGVDIAVINSKEWQLLLKPAFVSKLKAGKSEYIISIKDDSEAETQYVQDYIGEGLNSLTITKTKEWEGEATFKATVYNPMASEADATVTLYYKEPGDAEYRSVAMGNLQDNQMTATVSGLRGGRTYEGYLEYVAGGQTSTTAVASFSTPNGVQIPNGDMETWTNLNTAPMLPYADKQWWDTGNHGSATVGGNVTVYSDDVRPDSTGARSAKLQSQYVVVKFAAGNIFFGTYLGTSGTNGIIGFGQPFTFDYKPEKLTLWYKGSVGIIDKGSGVGDIGQGDSDKAQIYVWLCNSTQQYEVNTGDTSSFLNPDGTYANKSGEVPGLVAYGYWNRTNTSTVLNGVEVENPSYSDWTKLEIPLVYKEGVTEKPNMLVISCAASAYGDYFTGSTGSVMYVDDFEFVY